MSRLDLLNDCVEFLVVGAFAVSFHGHPRTTGDLDIWIKPSAANAPRVLTALQAFGAPAEALGVTESDFERADIVVQFGVPPRRIDLLTGLNGVAFEDAWPSREIVVLAGREVPVLGFDDLLKNKQVTGRAKDLLDIEELQRIRRAGPYAE